MPFFYSLCYCYAAIIDKSFITCDSHVFFLYFLLPFPETACISPVIPLGILRYPMFVEEYPMYLNFANLGIVIAHEITHGFDHQGENFINGFESGIHIWCLSIWKYFLNLYEAIQKMLTFQVGVHLENRLCALQTG